MEAPAAPATPAPARAARAAVPAPPAPRTPAPAPLHLLLFDAGGNPLWAHSRGAEPLPFAVGCLAASLAAYAADGGWALEAVQLEHAALRYSRCVRGSTQAAHKCRPRHSAPVR